MNSNFDYQLLAFRKGLDQGSLDLPEASDFFDNCLERHGSLWGGSDGLGCRDFLASFASHMHLGSIRTPPECILSKRNLSNGHAAHRPWIKLLDDDFDHDFYSDPENEIKKLLSGLAKRVKSSDAGQDINESAGGVDRYTIIEKTIEELEKADIIAFREKWPAICGLLRRVGVESGIIRNIEEEVYRGTDLPPVFSVNQGLEILEVPYKVTTRLRSETVFRAGTSDSQIEWDYSDTELALKDKSGTTHSLHDVGSGVKVIIPVIVALKTAEVELLSIEEPECHVHPKLQAELGDLLIARSHWSYYGGPIDGFHYQERFNPASRQRGHLFVETHSEHLILRILRRIRETTAGELADWPEALRRVCPNGIRPEDVAVLYVESGEDGARVIELPVDANGEFTCDWPGGFFEERMNELF